MLNPSSISTLRSLLFLDRRGAKTNLHSTYHVRMTNALGSDKFTRISWYMLDVFRKNSIKAERCSKKPRPSQSYFVSLLVNPR